MKTIKNKTPLMQLLELKNNETIEEQLRKLYVDDKKSIQEVAKELSIQSKTANKWLIQAGIDRRLNYEQLIAYAKGRKKVYE